MTDVPATADAWDPAAALCRVWPDPGAGASSGTLASAVAVGVLGATALPGNRLGIGALVVLLATVALAGRSAWARRDRYLGICACVVVALCGMVAVRDAGWLVLLCLLTALGTGVAALCGARTLTGVLACGVAGPLASVRGLPWLRTGIAGVLSSRWVTVWPLVRTALLTVVLLATFGALFAHADALFADWLDRVVPEVPPAVVVWRVVVFAVVTAAALLVAYLATVPPRVDDLAPGEAALVRRFEWAVPVALVDLMFTAFLAAQAAALFGGQDYIEQTTGLTYAEYVHRGFGELTAATVLTLVVVTVAARKAGRRSAIDRQLLRVLLGWLCLQTLVVVGSALHRMQLYEQAYGFTQLRLLVAAFEIWLGVLVALLLVAGIRLEGRWLPRAALLSGAGAILALALVNPDAYVAQRNVERLARTGHLDWRYLRSLSADAVPVLVTLPEPYRSCALHGVVPAKEDGLLGWNLGRSRAYETLRAEQIAPRSRCATLPSR